jgi:hypothetical protein
LAEATAVPITLAIIMDDLFHVIGYLNF